MARGGRRQGTPGVSYQNRSDLNVFHAPQQGTVTAASAGVVAPARPTAPQPAPAPVTPDQVPRLDDPSMRPNEPLTTGLDIGPGADSRAIGPVPTNPALLGIQAAYMRNPTPELRRALARLTAQGLI